MTIWPPGWCVSSVIPPRRKQFLILIYFCFFFWYDKKTLKHERKNAKIFDKETEVWKSKRHGDCGVGARRIYFVVEGKKKDDFLLFRFAIFQTFRFYLEFRDFYWFNTSDVRKSFKYALRRKLLKYYILLHNLYIHTFIAPFGGSFTLEWRKRMESDTNSAIESSCPRGKCKSKVQ